MIYLIWHAPSITDSKKRDKGFSIVSGKISLLKGFGQSMNRISTSLQHGMNAVPISIKEILYQEGKNVSIEDFKKRMQINKNTVVKNQKEIISILLS